MAYLLAPPLTHPFTATDNAAWTPFIHLVCVRFYFPATEVWQWNYMSLGYEYPLLNLKYKFSLPGSWHPILWFSGTTCEAPASDFYLPRERLHPELPQSHRRKMTSLLPFLQPLLWTTHSPSLYGPNTETLIILFSSLPPTSSEMSNPVGFSAIMSFGPPSFSASVARIVLTIP